MAISGRFVALVLLGLVPVLLSPGWLTVLATAAVLAALLVADLVFAASLRRVSVVRAEPENVTLNRSVDAVLTVRNSGSRALRGSLRDGWQPSAGAQNPVQDVDVPAGEGRRYAVRLLPVRRGDLAAPHVTLRSFGPLRLAA
ncbi:MAG TPA: DUF58 domain-containing protein, partial [Arthrobacter sp.]